MEKIYKEIEENQSSTQPNNENGAEMSSKEILEQSEHSSSTNEEDENVQKLNKGTNFNESKSSHKDMQDGNSEGIQPDELSEVPPVEEFLNENFRDELDHIPGNIGEEHFQEITQMANGNEVENDLKEDSSNDLISNVEDSFKEEGNDSGTPSEVQDSPKDDNMQEILSEREGQQTEDSQTEEIHITIVNKVPDEALHEITEEHDGDSGHEVEAEAEEEIDGLNKTELLKIVEEAIHFPESRKKNLQVQKARNEFFRMLDDERKEEKDKFFADEANEGKEYIAPHDPMVKDFNQAFKLFKTKRKEYIDDLNRQKDLNLQLKKEVLEKLKELIDSTETQSSFTEIKKLQEEWKKIGQVPIGDADNLWNSYNHYVNKFYDQFSLYSEFKDLDRKRNLSAKLELIASIEKLASMEDLNEAMRQLKQFQDEWRHIGPVPKENLEETISRYKDAVILIYEKKEKLSEELQKRREQNYEAKVEILDKLKEIIEFHSDKVQDWMDKNVEMGGWIEKWRAIGSVPLNKNEELKESLSEVIRKFNKNKNDFFRGRKREKVDNLKKKTDICELAESILNMEDLGSHKKEIIKLQEDWKKVGPVPPKFSDSIWKRFHTACDAFFGKLSEQYKDRDKEQQDNLARKNAIIDKIDGLSKEENVENVEAVIQQLQEEWDAIGFVPFKQKDDLRKRYYKSMGLLTGKYSGKGRFSKGNEMVSYKLMLESWTHDADGGRRVEQEAHRLLRDLKKMESEVSTLENNMHFLSNSKTAEQLKSNLDSQINKLKGKMNEMKDKIKIARQISGNRA
jgi:hypothetical protein